MLPASVIFPARMFKRSRYTACSSFSGPKPLPFASAGLLLMSDFETT